MATITPDIADQFLNTLCQKIEINKYAIDGPHRTVDSYGMTFSKSFLTICNEGYISHNCLNEALTETFESLTNNSFDNTCNNFDFKSYMLGLATIPVIIGGYKLVKRAYDDHKSNKENKKESKES